MQKLSLDETLSVPAFTNKVDKDVICKNSLYLSESAEAAETAMSAFLLACTAQQKNVDKANKGVYLR